jgi:hypothetical protein
VWGKPEGGGAPTSLAPTRTLCMLHQCTWFSAQPFTPARWVGCMCVVPGTIPNSGWPGTHRLLQAKAPFPMVVELEAKNLPPPGVELE